jgi:hypothetical protein
MIRPKYRVSRSTGLVIVLTLGVLLAACGGKEKSQPPQETPVAAQETPEETLEPTSPPVARPELTNTPYLLPSEPLFQEAADQARADLASRLDVSITQIKVLDPETALLLNAPLACPDVADENASLYYVYVQNGRSIYPYQFYAPSDGGEEVVEPCDDVLVDEEVLYVPTPDARAAVLDRVKADLTARGVDLQRGKFQTVQAMTWTDQALGCRIPPDQEPTPAVIDGYLVIYVLDGTPYEYHTDATGDRVSLCEQPAGYGSVEDFIATLQAIPDLDVEVISDETAYYNGLDAEGTLVALATGGYRVGLFGFKTPEEARAAAKRIDDVDVSHIYVAGEVLIVQEENSPQVYSTLLKYAEEVRTPILERLREESQSTEVPETSEPDE